MEFAVVLLILIFSIMALNNKMLNLNLGYLLSGALSFLFVVGLIYLITSTIS